MKARSRDVSLNPVYDPSIPKVLETDAKRLQQILVSLISVCVDPEQALYLPLTITLSFLFIQYNLLGNSGKLDSFSSWSRTSHLSTSHNNFVISVHLVKFSRPGGSVELWVSVCSPLVGSDDSRYSPSPAATFHKHDGAFGGGKKKVLQLVVKDYGNGIKRDDFERIFQPFLQSENAESIYGGTGRK